MSVNNDAIIIPIEIETKMSKEIEENIKKLEKLNKENKKAKDKKSRQVVGGRPNVKLKPKDKKSRQAIPTLPAGEGRGGIFGGRPNVKLKPKDKKSRQPFQRTDEFKNMKKELSQLGKAQKIADQRMGQIQELVALTSSGGIAKFALRLVPFIAPVLIAIGFAEMVMAEVFRDGGILDRRLNIKIEKQFLKLTKRIEALALSKGYTTLRVTTKAELRGPTSQVYSPQQSAKNNKSVLERDQESLSKNLF